MRSDDIATEAPKTDLGGETIRVLRVPSDPNHYQQLTVEALRDLRIETTRVGYLDLRLAVAPWCHDVVHIDWLDGFVRQSRPARQRLRAQVLLSLCVLGAMLSRRPLFWTLHNAAPHDGSTLAWRIWKRVLTWTATDVITHSSSAAAHARAISPRGSILTLPFGSFLDVFRPVESERARHIWTLADTDVVLVHFGQVRDQKGIDQILDLMHHLRGDDIRLLIAGVARGDLVREAITSAVESDLRIRWIDRFLDDDELSSLLCAADIALMPYQNALTSSSAQVAVELNLAIVAPDTGVFRDFAPHCPYLFPPADGTAGLAASTQMAIDHQRLGCLHHSSFDSVSWAAAVAPLAAAYTSATLRPRLRRYESRHPL